MLVLSSDPWTGTNWYLVGQYWQTDLDTTMKSIIFSVYILRRTNLASCLGRQGKKICDKLKYCREKVFLYKVFFSNLAVNCCKIKPPGLKIFYNIFAYFGNVRLRVSFAHRFGTLSVYCQELNGDRSFETPEIRASGMIDSMRRAVNPCCHTGTAIKYFVLDRVKPSFVIFDIRAL